MTARFVLFMYEKLKKLLIPRPNWPLSTTEFNMSSTSQWVEKVRNIIPPLTDDSHKGQAGRIGVIGGSVEYTGAPYFAAITALKIGADLVHIFCPKHAAAPIKSYSPELIVHPILDSPDAFKLIEPWLDRLHVIVIGSGLGRDSSILHTVTELIKKCKKIEMPLVFDADGLYLLTLDESIIHNYPNVILTPNSMEFQRLFGNHQNKLQTVIDKLGNHSTILEKAAVDAIYDTQNERTINCAIGGSNRRCGGQGDILAGAVAIFFHWATQSPQEKLPAAVACYGASYLTKLCNRMAFQEKGRSMTATDMIEKLHEAFKLFEMENSS